jgi:hypothetical protein
MAEVNPTGGAPDPTPEPKRGKRVTCGYCDCILDADGEIISMGKSAKEFRALRENDETRIKRIDELEKGLRVAIDKLKTYENDDGTPKTPTPTSSGGKKKTVLESVLGR